MPRSRSGSIWALRTSDWNGPFAGSRWGKIMNTQDRELQVTQDRELQDNELDEVSGGGFWAEYVDFMTDFASCVIAPLFSSCK